MTTGVYRGRELLKQHAHEMSALPRVNGDVAAGVHNLRDSGFGVPATFEESTTITRRQWEVPESDRNPSVRQGGARYHDLGYGEKNYRSYASPATDHETSVG